MVAAIQVIPRRMEVIAAYKTAGGSIAAVLPIHYPRALFRAFNILPVEVWGPPSVATGPGATHLQAYVCSIVHNALSFLQMGGLDVADILVVPHACDSLQGLGSILIDFVHPKQPVLPLYLPRGRRESDVAFLADELRSLADSLTAITGRSPSKDTFLACIQREETADALLAKLHWERQTLALTDLDFYRLVRSREYLPAETFMDVVEATLASTKGTAPSGLPLVFSGIVPEPMQVLAAISEMGGTVAADDFACCGRRLYPAGRSTEPFQRMAESILYGPPDSTRGSPIEARCQHLLHLVETTGAKGVIFYDVKFCEPELFDLPDLRRALADAGIPSLAVEVDIGDPLSHQVRTRLESFLEMVR